ncbi:hypothetical protein SAMN05421686_1221, partial [Thalassolituus maritimus]
MKQIPFNFGGNLCGHDKQVPDFRLVRPIKTGVAGIPLVLIMAVQRLTGYYDRPTLLPSLNRVNDSDRQQRSERREACIVTLASALKYTDLSSIRVGVLGISPRKRTNAFVTPATPGLQEGVTLNFLIVAE